MDNDLTLKAAALQLGFVTEAEFDASSIRRRWSNPMSQPPGSGRRDDYVKHAKNYE